MKKHLETSFLGLVTGLVNGLFGSGGGAILVPFLEKKFEIEERKSHATAISVILPISIVSSFIYFKNVDVDWKNLLLVIIGSIVGGYVGAKILNKISGGFIHLIFGITMVVAATRMIMS